MGKQKKTAAELRQLIREMSVNIGPWPPGMSVHVYSLDDSWRILVGYSDVAQEPFRRGLLTIAAQLATRFVLDEQTS